MISTKARRAVGALAVGLLFASCAGDSGGGITGSGYVIGPITALGSIVVNQIAFDVSDAAITIDGTPGTDNELRLGMVVEVRGSIDADAGTGVATDVTFKSDLRGTIDQVDPESGTVVVVGQVVLTSASTTYENTTLATLAPGDFVEVSGFRDGDGNVLATRIERKAESDDTEISGFIQALDTVARTFQIGAQLVDYAGAEVEDAPDGELSDGLFVEVVTTEPLSGGILFATTVKVESGELDGGEGEEVEIEGVVSSVTSVTEFVLNATRRIRTTESTRFEGGTAADIVVNRKLHAQGRLDTTSTLVAEKIELED